MGHDAQTSRVQRSVVGVDKARQKRAVLEKKTGSSLSIVVQRHSLAAAPLAHEIKDAHLCLQAQRKRRRRKGESEASSWWPTCFI